MTERTGEDAVARAELRKALANGKRAHYEGEGIKKTDFQTIENATPGVRMPANAFLHDGVVKKISHKALHKIHGAPRRKT